MPLAVRRERACSSVCSESKGVFATICASDAWRCGVLSGYSSLVAVSTRPAASHEHCGITSCAAPTSVLSVHERYATVRTPPPQVSGRLNTLRT